MRVVPSLNRRHKAVLFLTLLAAGFSLLQQPYIRVTFGIAMLGLALAWAIGSNSRVVHVLFLLLGLPIAVGPVLSDWYEHRKRIAEFRRTVEALGIQIPRMPKFNPQSKEPIDVTSFAELDHLMDASGYTVEHRLELKQELEKLALQPEGQGSRKITVGIRPSVIGGVEGEKIEVSADLNPNFFRPVPKEPKPFAFGESVASNQRLLIPGLLLMVVGSGLILGIRPRAPVG